MRTYAQIVTVVLVTFAFFAVIGVLALSPPARAQDCAWLPGQVMWGANADVRALTVYNAELIAGGWFTAVGGVTCNRVARWDSSAWQPLGSGMNAAVYALTVYDGELIAGGEFTTAGGVTCNRIARWDGSVWQPLGSGMNSAVYALLKTCLRGERVAGSR